MGSHKYIKYTELKKTKCEVCGSSEDLTVHHIIGTEFIRLLKSYVLKPSDLSTLCETCHEELEAEIDEVIKEDLGAHPMFEAMVQAKSDYAMLKQIEDDTLTCNPPKESMRKRMECTVLLALGSLDFTEEPVWPKASRFEHVRDMDEARVCIMLRTYFRAWKIKKKLLL